jgi:hypothetical protein
MVLLKYTYLLDLASAHAMEQTYKDMVRTGRMIDIYLYALMKHTATRQQNMNLNYVLWSTAL